MEVELKKWEDEIKKDFLDKKTRVVNTRTGIISCLSLFSLSVCSDLVISTIILVPLGSSSTVKAYAISLMVISAISLASSDASILLIQKSLNRSIKD